MIPLPTTDVLDDLTIPLSCPVPWDAMRGDHRTRFCDQCRQSVHDVSELTRADAVRLVTGGAGSPCVRLYRRRDGRVMTADCSGRRERAWKWLYHRAPWLAAAFTAVFFAGCGSSPVGCTAGAPLPVTPPDDAAGSIAGGAAVGAARGR